MEAGKFVLKTMEQLSLYPAINFGVRCSTAIIQLMLELTIYTVVSDACYLADSSTSMITESTGTKVINYKIVKVLAMKSLVHSLLPGSGRQQQPGFEPALTQTT